MTIAHKTASDMQAAIRKADAEVRRLERLPDPGQGHPLGKAKALRDRHLRRLKHATAELEGLREEWRAGDPREVERRTVAERILRRARRQAIAEAQRPEDEKHLREVYLEMQSSQEQRETAHRLEELADRLKHPPDPQATSILAAVMSDSVVLDCIEVKLRPIDGEQGMTMDHVLDAHDLGVLVVMLTLLQERNPVRVDGWAQAARWPKRQPRLAPVENLRASLLELRRVGLLDLRPEGGTAAVTYGPRTQEIAARWGIEAPAEGDQAPSV
jgi:hypothetical protein